MKKAVMLYLPLFMSLPLPAMAEQSQICKDTTSQEIAALFDRWNASLKTGDPEKVADNYTQNAVLLPTMSDKSRKNKAERIDYFKAFLKEKPDGTIVNRTIMIGCNSAIDVGLYDFKFSSGTVIKARYTFIYQFDGKNWLISSHHSSRQPGVCQRC